MPQFHHFKNADALNQQLTADTAARLNACIDDQGRATLVVSGGRYPIRFFETLAKIRLDWSKVFITLADERWVAPDSMDSNENLVRAHLLVDHASAATFVPMWTKDASHIAAAPSRTAAIAALPSPFAEVVLGMGEDGHTASLFPYAATLATSLDTRAAPAVLAINQPAPPNAPYARLTLNLAAILSTRHITLLIQGEKKRAVYEAVMYSKNSAQYPIASVLTQTNVPVDVFYTP